MSLGNRLRALGTAVVFALITSVMMTPGTARAAPCLGLPADDGACVTAEAFPDPRTLDLTISSPSLDMARFPNNTNKVRLRLPPGWSKTATRTWPALWMLHGLAGNHTAYGTTGADFKYLGDTEVLTVIPASGCGAGYLDWRNATGKPAWETYHLTELRQILERNYRAGTSRAILGISMGGHGALGYATRNPGMFKAAAGMSVGHEPLLTPAQRLDDKNIAILHANTCRDWGWTTYPGGYTYPWQEPRGDPTLDADLPKWVAGSAWRQAPRLVGVPIYLYLSSGNGKCYPGEPWCYGEDAGEKANAAKTTAFHGELTRLGIPSELRIYDGKHNEYAFVRELPGALTKVLTALGVPYRPTT